jgi:hypothetical protein
VKERNDFSKQLTGVRQIKGDVVSRPTASRVMAGGLGTNAGKDKVAEIMGQL